MCGHTLRVRIDVKTESYALPGRTSLRYDALKNWTVKYLQFTWNLARLRSVYAPSRTTPDVLHSAIELTFASCHSLGAWLTAGPEPQSVTAGDVARLFEVAPLEVCKALATCTNTGARARIEVVHLGHAARGWVEFAQPGKRAVRYDALDLADRCLAAWNCFLRDRDVALPSWTDS